MVGLLKIIGVLGLIGSLITGLSWNDSMGGHGEYVIPCAIAGIINCVICFALATCVKALPQLNLAWICTGDGAMLMQGGDNALNADYKQAYEGAMMQVEALNRIIKQLNK